MKERSKKRHRVYQSYQDYKENIVDKCGHKYIILQSKNFRDYKISLNSNPDQKTPPGVHYKITPAKCKSYSCPVCGRKKVLDLLDRLKKVDFSKYRFFTLTLVNKYSAEDTINNLKRVSECFNKLNKTLRKNPIYKGLEYFRITEIGKNGMVHIHGIWNKYIPQKELSKIWFAITKDSYRAKVERIKSPHDAIEYLYKYLTKDVANYHGKQDKSFFESDEKTNIELFYELGKRRYQASRKFFQGKEVKNTDFVPYYFESQDTHTVETFIQSHANMFKLTKDNFDFTYYFESDLFIDELFKPKNNKPPG